MPNEEHAEVTIRRARLPRAGRLLHIGSVAVLRFALIVMIALSSVGTADAQQRQRTSPQPLPTKPNQQQQTIPDNRGTDQVPLVVKEVPRERTAEERKEAQDKSDV